MCIQAAAPLAQNDNTACILSHAQQVGQAHHLRISPVQEMEARYTALEEEHHGLATEKAKLQANSESCVKASCCSCIGTHLLQIAAESCLELLLPATVGTGPADLSPAGPASSLRVCAITAGANCFQEGVS